MSWLLRSFLARMCVCRPRAGAIIQLCVGFHRTCASTHFNRSKSTIDSSQQTFTRRRAQSKFVQPRGKSLRTCCKMVQGCPKSWHICEFCALASSAMMTWMRAKVTCCTTPSPSGRQDLLLVAGKIAVGEAGCSFPHLGPGCLAVCGWVIQICEKASTSHRCRCKRLQ